MRNTLLTMFMVASAVCMVSCDDDAKKDQVSQSDTDGITGLDLSDSAGADGELTTTDGIVDKDTIDLVNDTTDVLDLIHDTVDSDFVGDTYTDNVEIIDLVTDKIGDLSDIDIADDISDTTADVFVPPPAGELVINEFIVAETAQEAIEFLNLSSSPIDLTSWRVEASWPVPYGFPLPSITLEPGGIIAVKRKDVFTGSDNTSMFPNEGGTIYLIDPDGSIEDQVSYGIAGNAPVALYGTSIARVPNSSDSGFDAVDFNWDPTPTIGEPNDVPAVNLGSLAVELSEILITSDATGFLELRINEGAVIDLSGFSIVVTSGAGSSAFSIGSLANQEGLVVFDGYLWSELFAEKARGLLYVFDAAGKRILQRGWSNVPADAGSVGYLTPQTGPAWCYDTSTCGLQLLTPTRDSENLPYAQN